MPEVIEESDTIHNETEKIETNLPDVNHDRINNNDTKNEDEQNLMPKPDAIGGRTYEPAGKRKQRLASIATIISIEKMRGVKCRTVLWYVAFVGFMVNYMYRININIAIVEMVSNQKTIVSNQHASECLQVLVNQTNFTSPLEISPPQENV